jgi:hypothetical protein
MGLNWMVGTTLYDKRHDFSQSTVTSSTRFESVVMAVFCDEAPALLRENILAIPALSCGVSFKQTT